jgi:hypothetical protein
MSECEALVKCPFCQQLVLWDFKGDTEEDPNYFGENVCEHTVFLHSAVMHLWSEGNEIVHTGNRRLDANIKKHVSHEHSADPMALSKDVAKILRQFKHDAESWSVRVASARAQHDLESTDEGPTYTLVFMKRTRRSVGRQHELAGHGAAVRRIR